MKGPLATLLGALLIVAGLTGWGLYERHLGAQAVEARVRAESLLVAAKTAQDSILRVDSVRSAQADSAQDALRRVIGALQAQRRASQQRADSFAAALERDSLPPRDSVGALITAFRGERAAADSQIATLTSENRLLRGEISAKDSTIRALNTLLDGNRRQLAQALKPQSPGLLERAERIAELVLAVRGGIAFAVGR